MRDGCFYCRVVDMVDATAATTVAPLAATAKSHRLLNCFACGFHVKYNKFVYVAQIVMHASKSYGI